MSSVNRLGVCGPIYECDDGKYVLASDYYALAAEVEALRRDAGAEMFLTLTGEIVQLKAEVARLRGDADRLDRLDVECEAYGCEDIHEGNRWMIDGPFRTARDAIDALPPIEQPAPPDHDIDLDELFSSGGGNKARRRAEALGIDYDAAMAQQAPSA